MLTPEPASLHADGIIPTSGGLAEDMQVLTNKGFLFLDDLSNIPLKEILFCGYDPESKQLVYEEAAALVHTPSRPQPMIEISQTAEAERWGPSSDARGRRDPVPNGERQHSNAVSLLITPECNIICRLGRICYSSSRPGGFPKWRAGEFAAIPGQQLLPTASEKSAVKLLGRAKHGSGSGAIAVERLPPRDVLESLRIWTPLHIHTFLKLYGYWLGDGSLKFRSTRITFSFVKMADRDFLDGAMRILGLVENIDYRKRGPYGVEKAYNYFICSSPWVKLFHDLYKQKYRGASLTTTTTSGTSSGGTTLAAVDGNAFSAANATTTTSDTLEKTEWIKSAKWCSPWVWNLGMEEARSIISGLHLADGRTGDALIFTSSIRFRDEIVRLCLHSGYSARFRLQQAAGHDGGIVRGRRIIAKHDGWVVAFPHAEGHANPTVRANKDIKVMSYTGRTWNVVLPHGHIIVRRASTGRGGEVLKASMPLIVGAASSTSPANSALQSQK